MRTIKKIVVCSSETKEGMDYRARDINVRHKNKGMQCIAYHYVIDLDGTVEHGRPEQMRSAGIGKSTTDTLSVCYVGGVGKDGFYKDTRTPEQKDALINFLSELKERFPIAEIVGYDNNDALCFDPVEEYSKII